MTQTQPDYANDPDLQAGGDWVKWDAVGDSVTGVVTGFRKGPARIKADGTSKTNGVYEITKEDESVVNIEIGQVFLKGLFKDEQVAIGDTVRITYSADEKIAGKASSMKKFTLEVRKGGQLPSSTVVNNTDAALETLQSKLGASVVEKAPF